MLDPHGDYNLILASGVSDPSNANNIRSSPSMGDNSNFLCHSNLIVPMPRFFRRFGYKCILVSTPRSLILLAFSISIIVFLLCYIINNENINTDFVLSDITKRMNAKKDHDNRPWIYKSKFFKKQIVHLDLKGAAPRPEYLLDLFPLFKSLGFTGILVEYEDMFPYSSGLSSLARKSAYNKTIIKQLNKAANDFGLEYIPLIQTFGHMEFALKHREFTSLREDPDWMDTICPSNERSIWLIREMLAQIRRLHPVIKSIHIGCDEAWHIAQDNACQLRLNTTLNGSISRLKLEHISRIARMAKDEFDFDEVYAWNDMFDKIAVPLLSEYKLGSLLIPVVWGYNRDVTRPGYFPDGLFERYSQVFDEVYFAGAFKGADGVTQQFVDIDRYQQNLDSYRRLYRENEKYLKNRLTGIVLTGWQRFSHNKPLCEILPAGIPALAREAIFLSKWDEQNVSKDQIDRQLRIFLNCTKDPIHSANDLTYEGIQFPFLFEVQLSECNFPGVELYEQIEQWNVLLWKAALERKKKEKTTTNGKKRLEEFEKELNELRERITPILGKIYYEDTVKEWLAQHARMEYFEADDISVSRFDPI